ncbi:MAG: S-ribosylhomocysteine lyase [Chloroflexi bacterium AL-N5]|nr:S-ribosylhomocysteine lyase [Chloroflexi bacterium AL-N5]
MTQPKTKVESFNLDHTKVRAPYVRLAGSYTGTRGDQITKYDLRLVQPNQTEIPTAALHTIEHLMAGYLRDALAHTIIDASPMGCRTGFYLTILGTPQPEEVRVAMTHALQGVTTHEGEIPGCSELECGNYRDHSLPGAKAWAARVLQEDIIVQETIPIANKKADHQV